MTIARRLVLLLAVPLAATVVITTLVVHQSTRQFVEAEIGEQMVMQARIASHLVAIAEQQNTNGLSREAINRHFKDIFSRLGLIYSEHLPCDESGLIGGEKRCGISNFYGFAFYGKRNEF